MNKTAFALAIAAASAVAAADVSNASFESSIDYGGNSVGNWTAFFGGADFQQAEIVVPQIPAVDGTSALQIGTFNTPNTFVGVVQRIALSGQGDYTFSLWAREVVQRGANVEFRIEWLNAANGIIGDQFALNTNITNSLTEAWQQFSVSGSTPVNAVAANLVIAVQTFGAASPFEGFFQFDAVTFIPAPAAPALLAAAGIVASRRRR